MAQMKRIKHYWKKLLVSWPWSFPFWYVSLRAPYTPFILSNSRSKCDLCFSSSISAIKSASERAVKNLFRRLYSGLDDKDSGVSPGDGT